MKAPSWTQDAYLKAWDFACIAHQGQTYIGQTSDLVYDYINHLAGVAMEVMHALPQHPKYDGNLALQCALLHDTLEDTVTTYEQLQAQFGYAVAEGVLALTKNSVLPKSDQIPDSLQRIQHQPKEIWLVKLADRINNLAYPHPLWNTDKITAYQHEAQYILDTLGAASPVLSKRLADHIERFSF